MTLVSEGCLQEGVPLHVYPVLSSTSRSLKVALGAAFTVLAVTGGAFALRGAWPVAVATTMTGGLLTGAFSACVRKSRQRQTLLLEGPHLHIDTLLPYRGRAIRVSLNAGWTRAGLAAEDRAGQPHGPDSLMEVTKRLRLTDGQRTIYIGDFLPPDERPALKTIIETGLQAHCHYRYG